MQGPEPGPQKSVAAPWGLVTPKCPPREARGPGPSPRVRAVSYGGELRAGEAFADSSNLELVCVLS